MGELASRLVQQIAGARTVEDLEDAIWIAGDLLKKPRMSNHSSHFDAVNREVVTDSDRSAIQRALLDALSRNTEPRFVANILSALSSSGDESLVPVWVEQLARYLDLMKAANAIVYTALIALDQLGEATLPDRSASRSIADVENNMTRATNYLRTRGISVPM